MKKIMSIAVALVLVLCSSLPSFAAERKTYADPVSTSERIVMLGEHYKASLPEAAADESFILSDGHKVLRYENTLYITYGNEVWEIPVKLRDPYDCGVFDPYPASTPKDFCFVAEDGQAYYVIVGIKTLIACGTLGKDDSLKRSGEYVLLGGAGSYKPAGYTTFSNGWQTAKSGSWLYVIDPWKNVYVFSKNAPMSGQLGEDGLLYWIDGSGSLRRTANYTNSSDSEYVTGSVSNMASLTGSDGHMYIKGYLRSNDEGTLYWLEDLGLSGYAPEIAVMLDGTKLTFTGRPVINLEGRNYAPLRELADALGAGVKWEDGSPVIETNGKVIEIEEIIIQDGVYMVTIRSLAEALGAVVSWDAESQAVLIER